MIGIYRLFRQVDGRTYFAELEVELAPTTSKGRSEVSFDAGDHNTLPGEWLAAAERGCLEALTALASINVLAGTIFQVRVKRLLANWVDTTVDSVYAASYLAVTAASGAGERFELHHDGQWRVKLRDDA